MVMYSIKMKWNESTYNFEYAHVDKMFELFDFYEAEATRLMEAELPLPAYEQVIKASHSFNLLDARGAISVTERQRYILRVRTLARSIAQSYVAARAKLGFPMAEPHLRDEVLAQLKAQVEAEAAQAEKSSGEQIMSKHTVLFELGCEELPPKSLKTLRDALQAETVKGLKDAGLAFDSIEAYAAPRRLALKIVNVDAAQADTQKRFDGPAVQAAYDAEGKPTKALEGFMRGQGITVDQVSTFQAGKVEKVCYLKDVKGQSLDALLPQILQTALDNLPIAKRMRSAASRTEFVRPVKWVVLLKDNRCG